jgi:hypothetical protein
MLTDHVLASAWLARQFLGADVRTEEGLVTVRGVGFQRKPAYVSG